MNDEGAFDIRKIETLQKKSRKKSYFVCIFRHTKEAATEAPASRNY